MHTRHHGYYQTGVTIKKSTLKDIQPQESPETVRPRTDHTDCLVAPDNFPGADLGKIINSS